jgi:Zn-dependent membrane protease YugP
MPRPQHSPLFWAAHIGGACAWVALVVGVLVYTTTSAPVGQTIFSAGVLGVLTAGGLSVAGSQRRRRGSPRE